MPPLPAARRAALAAATGAAVDGRGGRSSWSIAARTTTCSRSPPPVATPARALVHVKEAFAEQGSEPAVPAADLAALTRLEIDGALTATQAKAVLAELVANGGGDAAAIAAAKGFEAMDTRCARGDRRRRHRRATRRAWEKFVAGEDKAARRAGRRRDEGVEGPGRRQAVTGLLRSKAGR